MNKYSYFITWKL